ncbi:chloramphenicol phosphotransferase [Streptomyces ipomoeae]|uniref:Chloramphenicol phosphotransferase n=1 Tax=Streptomyces ipomoeae TaxID=103232 RepID=A0AAE9B3S1_9ACTN|nr:chloramphenicol phosphotransferase [Streptomyces ipomoeae]
MSPSEPGADTQRQGDAERSHSPRGLIIFLNGTSSSGKSSATALHNTRRGYHRAVAGMAAAGNNVVVNHVLSEEWRLRDCLELFVPQDVVFVGVHCPGAELERRERQRGDRPVGLAARQLRVAHAHGIYDVGCDTSRADALECALNICALNIKEFLPRRPQPTAFQRLLDKRCR